MVTQLWAPLQPLKPSQEVQGVLGSSRGALNSAPIMPRDATISTNSGCNFFQFIYVTYIDNFLNDHITSLKCDFQVNIR